MILFPYFLDIHELETLFSKVQEEMWAIKIKKASQRSSHRNSRVSKKQKSSMSSASKEIIISLNNSVSKKLSRQNSMHSESRSVHNFLYSNIKKKKSSRSQLALESSRSGMSDNSAPDEVVVEEKERQYGIEMEFISINNKIQKILVQFNLKGILNYNDQINFIIREVNDDNSIEQLQLDSLPFIKHVV